MKSDFCRSKSKKESLNLNRGKSIPEKGKGENFEGVAKPV